MAFQLSCIIQECVYIVCMHPGMQICVDAHGHMYTQQREQSIRCRKNQASKFYTIQKKGKFSELNIYMKYLKSHVAP